MMFALIALLAVSPLELSLYLSPIWKLRRPYGLIVLFLAALASGALFTAHLGVSAWLLGLIGLYRLCNLLRVLQGRIEAHFLRRVTLRTSIWLIGLQLVVLGAWRLGTAVGLTWRGCLGIVSGLQLATALILVVSTRSQLRRSRARPAASTTADRDLPAVSVCVPARNETEELTACLEALIASDYPKLEILVLDDCSQDRTSDVIKSFAHAGVRFVKGMEPPSGWLAKNWAYQQLYEQASGELLLFCGVDVRLEPTSIRQLVATALAERSQMVSLMPLNQLPAPGKLVALLLQPFRYGWELSLPRRLFSRPPVISSCWLIARQMMTQAGSFAAVAQSISPESYFARHAAQTNAYKFVCSSPQLGVSSQKLTAEQWQTAVRTRYPQLRRRPELVLGLSLFELLGATAPLLAIYAFITGMGLIAGMALAATTLFASVYGSLLRTTYGRLYALGLIGFVGALLLDITIRHYSMVRYEFSDVIWKGRNICLPVMRITPRLPKV